MTDSPARSATKRSPGSGTSSDRPTSTHWRNQDALALGFPDLVAHIARRVERRRQGSARRHRVDAIRVRPDPRPGVRHSGALPHSGSFRASMPETPVFITADDGVRLAATLYRPDGDGSVRGAARGAAVPQGRPHRVVRGDVRRLVHAGFAVLRLDLRGTGSSGGIATDEYPDVERTDLRAAIDWLAAAAVVDGTGRDVRHVVLRVQLAADGGGASELGVGALGAVVAMYATDDRYTDDVHYGGGVLRAIDLIDYPTYMVAMNALPPVPAVFGDGWRDEWRRRIDGTPAWVTEWIEHPLDGPTWRRGSIRLGPQGAGYERMGCPTMLIAGWADGYRNNTFRVVEQYGRNGLPWRLLAGPWVQQVPGARPARPEHRRRPRDHRLLRPPPARRSTDVDRERPGVRALRRRSGTRPGRPPRPLGRPRRVAAARADGAALDVRRQRRRGDARFAATSALPRGTRAPARCRGASRSTSAPTTPGRSRASGRSPSGPRCSATRRVSLRVMPDRSYGHVVGEAVRCRCPTATSALITRGMLDLTPPRLLAGRPRWRRRIVLRRPSHPVSGSTLAIELEATTWTLDARPPRPAGDRRERLAELLAASRAGHPVGRAVRRSSSSFRWSTAAPASAHEFAPGVGPSDDDGDGVTWRIEHDVLGRETRVVTRYGSTYDGLHGAVVTDDYAGSSACRRSTRRWRGPADGAGSRSAGPRPQ